MYIHLIGQVITILWTTSFYHSIVGMFIPIAGRSGGVHNPDVTIGMICCLFTLFITSYIVSCVHAIHDTEKAYRYHIFCQIPLVGLLHRPKLLLFGLLAAYILTRISFTTHIDFPYYDDANKNPTPQRHFVTVNFQQFRIRFAIYDEIIQNVSNIHFSSTLSERCMTSMDV